MKKNLLIKITFAVVLIIISISCSKPKVELRLNLQKDQNFLMSYQTDMKMNQKLMGMSIDMVMNMSMDLNFKTMDIDKDSNYLMSVTYQSLSYKMKSQGQSIEFGTDGKTNDTVFHNVFNMLKGKTFNMKLSKTGKILEVKGIDTLIQNLCDETIKDSLRFKEFKEVFNKNFGEESIKSSFGSFFGFYPEKAISVGEKWSNSHSVLSFFALNIEDHYLLKDTKDNMYNIDLLSNLKTDPKNASINISGMEMKFDMKGNQNGNIKIDQKTGWIVESEIKQNITGNATMSSNGMPGGGNFAIPYTVEATTKITTKK